MLPGIVTNLHFSLERAEAGIIVEIIYLLNAQTAACVFGSGETPPIITYSHVTFQWWKMA